MAVQPVIDPQTGALHFDDGIVFGPDASIGSVLAVDAPEPLGFREMGNGWAWVDVRNLRADGLYFLVSVAFLDDVLEVGSLAVRRGKFGSQTWADWSPEVDRENLAFMESWLTSELGDRREFAWGRIGASIDSKTGQGVSIWINYARTVR